VSAVCAAGAIVLGKLNIPVAAQIYFLREGKTSLRTGNNTQLAAFASFRVNENRSFYHKNLNIKLI